MWDPKNPPEGDPSIPAQRGPSWELGPAVTSCRAIGTWSWPPDCQREGLYWTFVKKSAKQVLLIFRLLPVGERDFRIELSSTPLKQKVGGFLNTGVLQENAEGGWGGWSRWSGHPCSLTGTYPEEKHTSHIFMMETDWSKEAPEISIIPGTGRGGTMSPDVCISQRRLPGPRGNILGSKRFISQKSREKMYSSMFPKVIVKEKVERGSVVRLEQ